MKNPQSSSTCRVAFAFLTLALSSLVLGQSGWKRVQIGSSAASIEVPFAVQRSNESLSPASMKQMVAFEVLRGESPSSTILLSYGKFKKPQGHLDAAAKAAIANMRSTAGSGPFASTVKPTRISGRQARLLTLKFGIAPKAVTYQQLIVDHGLHRWQIVVYFPSDSKQGPLAAKRMFGSLKFKQPQKRQSLLRL